MTVRNTKKLNGSLASAYGHDEDLATHFGALDLSRSSTSAIPDSDSCLAHLRLLAAFEKLRNRVGHQDGIWDIWDKRAASADNSLDVLVKLREKRWAIYVARAVDRYEAWWRSFDSDMLLEEEMAVGADSARYERFTAAKPASWRATMLPPIDILLAWHAHMLNPRLYLEDCLRYDYGPLWASGIPWKLVDAAIGNDLSYSVSAECKETWTSRTGSDWDNASDPLDKELRCPSCATKLRIPWTTCGVPKDYKGDRRPGLAGEGFGDGQLDYACSKCRFAITHDSLRLHKFRLDLQALVADDETLPGTLLDLRTGLPKPISKKSDDRLFPGRLARRGLLVGVLEQLKPGVGNGASMTTVRSMLESIANVTKDKKGAVELPLAGRIFTRRMMSRYWNNSSFAAFNLCGAILRQGVFTAKINQIDWLHSPTSRATMERLLLKYTRYIAILAAHPGEPAVPTLDIDLAWHTHQLSPKSYLDYTVAKTGTLVDHSDRVDEDMLSIAFEWTSRVYSKTYGEAYSDCACWYCDSIRAMSSSGVTPMFQQSTEQNVHLSEAAHISSHSSVHTNETPDRAARTRALRESHQEKLLQAYSDNQRRLAISPANKNKPLTGQRGHDKVDFWGKSVQIESPASSALAAATTPVMYATPPGTVEAGPGTLGSCASGTCNGSSGCGSETSLAMGASWCTEEL